MFNGKMKAITFSYDDATLQDKRLIEILNRYHLKATFNVNSGLLGTEKKLEREGKMIDWTKFQETEIAKIYQGHEVAAHTLRHKSLPLLSDEDVVMHVEEDRKKLSELVGYEVVGMAYPGGGVNHDDRVVDLIKNELKRGRKLINTHCYPYYFDFPYGWNTLKMVCEDDGALTDNDEETWGIEAQMWTEYVPDMKKLEFLTFPRLGAMAENAWAEKGYPSFATFLHKAKDYFKLLDVYKVGYAKIKKACPSFIYKHASSIWFKRRVFHWQGLHNLIDDAKAKKEAEKYAQNRKG